MCSIYSPIPTPYPVDLGLSLPNDTDNCYIITSYNEEMTNVPISVSQSSSTFATISWALDSNETFLRYSVIFAVEVDHGGFTEVVVTGGGETLSILTLEAFPNDVGVYQFEITDCFDKWMASTSFHMTINTIRIDIKNVSYAAISSCIDCLTYSPTSFPIPNYNLTLPIPPTQLCRSSVEFNSSFTSFNTSIEEGDMDEPVVIWLEF